MAGLVAASSVRRRGAHQRAARGRLSGAKERSRRSNGLSASVRRPLIGWAARTRVPTLSLGLRHLKNKPGFGVAGMNSLFAALHDQMTFRRVRLVCGLIMFAYLAGHLTMHALGNISWQAMEAGARVHDFIWQSAVGATVLYGAFTFHFGLALWALYDRRSFRMGVGEWARLLPGFFIVPLLHHFTAGRLADNGSGHRFKKWFGKPDSVPKVRKCGSSR